MIGYEELYEKYQKLLEENKRLRIENENYKVQLGLVSPKFDSEVQSEIEIFSTQSEQFHSLEQVINTSSPQEKINLFMSLFRGRTDVYAKKWQSKEGKSGYSPVCMNEWSKGVCNKPRIKCSDCTNKDYAILDSAAIDNHLRGRAVYGIYPMLPDETCFLLAMDFDDEGWQKDINALRDICVKMDIPTAIERSQSGNGARILQWIFCTEKQGVDAGF